MNSSGPGSLNKKGNSGLCRSTWAWGIKKLFYHNSISHVIAKASGALFSIEGDPVHDQHKRHCWGGFCCSGTFLLPVACLRIFLLASSCHPVVFLAFVMKPLPFSTTEPLQGFDNILQFLNCHGFLLMEVGVMPPVRWYLSPRS